jgi:FlaA1/EpsC-like NDP-sugar epimerase
MIAIDSTAQERLLGRQVSDVLTDADRARYAGQRVLVTGAGGSVGSELARQLAGAGVSRLTLMDHSEYALFLIERAIREAHAPVDVVAVLGDVTRRADVREACAAASPHVVYHAAAYKHVTYAERALVQAARVNVLGAAELVQGARDAGARFVLVSSDKAAEPRSVMGATKRFAEQVVLAQANASFRPIVVRFGNILGSSGSVAEIMLAQARSGCPLPVTHPGATRYFMTGGEAVALVLKADLIGRRAEIFWLDMGEPVRIGELAARIAEYVASSGGPAVETQIIGLRPGEKMHEELTSQGLAMHRTAHPRILSARQRPVPPAPIRGALNAVSRACSQGDAAAVLSVLQRIVTDYVPSDLAIACAAGGQLQAQVPAA